MRTHIVLDLEAPMMSFGSVVVGDSSPTDDLPGPSFLTGLLANAMGWDRRDAEAHQDLQRRIVFAAAEVNPGTTVVDFQTARLAQNDAGWTTRGAPEGRATSPSFKVDPDDLRRTGDARKVQTHRRWRHARAESRVIVALGLRPSERGPDIRHLADALSRPERPLFLGRKQFVPSRRILAGEVEARTVRGALWEWLSLESENAGSIMAIWSASEGGEGREIRTHSSKDWGTGVHVGESVLMRGTLS